MKIAHQNWGHSMVVYEANNGDECVKTCTLDTYLAGHNIDLADIKYVWLDVEGHEPEVLEGAAGLYMDCRIPLCLEFNQNVYKEHGNYEKMLEMLERYFEKFVVCRHIQNDEIVFRSVEELPLLWNEFNGEPCDLILL